MRNPAQHDSGKWTVLDYPAAMDINHKVIVYFFSPEPQLTPEVLSTLSLPFLLHRLSNVETFEIIVLGKIFWKYNVREQPNLSK